MTWFTLISGTYELLDDVDGLVKTKVKQSLWLCTVFV